MSEPIERWHETEDIVESARRLHQFPFLDEFIAYNVDIHFEAMGHAQFWMLVRCRETGREWHLNFGAVSTRVKGYAMAEEDTIAPLAPLAAPRSDDGPVPRVPGPSSEREGGR